MRTRMRLGVHQLHHIRGRGEVPDGEAENNRWRGHSVCDGHLGLRAVCGDTQNTSGEITPSTSFFPAVVHESDRLCLTAPINGCGELATRDGGETRRDPSGRIDFSLYTLRTLPRYLVSHHNISIVRIVVNTLTPSTMLVILWYQAWPGRVLQALVFRLLRACMVLISCAQLASVILY